MARWRPSVRKWGPDIPSKPRGLTIDPCNKVTFAACFLDQPLTGTAKLEPCAVHQQVDRFAAGSRSRHRQCLAPSADRRMVGCCEIKTKQPKKGCDQPFGLA